MLSIYIMLFIAIAVASGIGYAIVTLISNAQISLAVQQNQVRLQNISVAVRASLTTDGGNVLLPVKMENGTVIARLPASSPFSTTTSGGDIVFCPAFPDRGTSGEMVNDRSDAEPEIFGVALSELAGRTYIKAGHAPELETENVGLPENGTATTRLQRLNEMGVIAYLLSPQPNYTGSLGCGDVRIAADNYTLLIDGGTVVPVYTVTTDARSSIFVLSADGDTPSGYNGTDRVVRTMADVTNFVKKYEISDITIRLPEGGIEVALEEFNDLMKAGAARTIRFTPGQTPDGDEIAESSVTLTSEMVSANNVYVTVLGNLALTDTVIRGNAETGGFDVGIEASPASSVTLIDSEVSAVKAKGGRISILGESRIVPRYGFDTVLRPVIAEGGDILLDSNHEPAVAAGNAVFAFYANAGTISLASGLSVEVDPGRGFQQSIMAENGGRIIGTDVRVVRNGVSASETLLAGRETFAVSCEDGAVNCVASCQTPGKTVVSGGCFSDSGSPLISFGPTGDTTYACSFSSLPPTVRPEAKVVCDYP